MVVLTHFGKRTRFHFQITSPLFLNPSQIACHDLFANLSYKNEVVNIFEVYQLLEICN